MNTRKSLYVERLSASTAFRKEFTFSTDYKIFYVVFDSKWHFRAIKNLQSILIWPTCNLIGLFRFKCELNISWSIQNIIMLMQVYNVRKIVLRNNIKELYFDYENQLIDKILIKAIRGLDLKIIGLQRFLVDRSDFPHLAPVTIIKEEFKPHIILCEGPSPYINCLNNGLSEKIFFKLETQSLREQLTSFHRDTLHIYVILGPYMLHVKKILNFLKSYHGNFEVELLTHPLNNQQKVIRMFNHFNPRIKKDRRTFNSNSIVLSEPNSFLVQLDGKCQKILLFGPQADQCYKDLFKITKPTYVT